MVFLWGKKTLSHALSALLQVKALTIVCVLNLLLSLSSFVMILKAFFVSCSKIPHVPTYDGHFDRVTVTRRNKRISKP